MKFTGLTEDVYRLTIRDTITDTAGNNLDGNSNGTAGDNWVADFVVVSGDAMFSTAGTCASGTSPYGLSTGDFNGDGKLDLAVTNNALSGTVTILLGNENGGFTTAASYSSGGYTPRTVAVADFNKDGNLDLAVTNYGDGTIAILMGNGNGTFGPATTFDAGGSNPQGIAVADFNGDGFPDIATTCWSSGTIGVLLSNGSGSFTTIAYSDWNWPDDIAVADFNKDGNLDLVVADGYCADGVGAVRLFLGDGIGGFSVSSSFSTGGSWSQGIAVGDLNADGHMDVVVSNYNTDTIGILLGDGCGGFDTTIVLQTGSYSNYGITIADFNGDGDLDIAVDTQYGGNGNIFLGDGSGSFSIASVINTGMQFQVDITSGDFDGDGKTDLAVANFSDDSVGVWSNIPSFAPVSLTSASGLPFKIAVGTFGAGQLIQGSNNAFDGYGRLIVDGVAYRSDDSLYTTEDDGKTIVTGDDTIDGLTVSRKITVPNTGDEDFARTIDSFTNNSDTAITTTVTIVGNLGSDDDTMVFATSDGDTIVEATDQWIGTDDADGSGTPAIIHYIHGPLGLQPTSVSVIGDNITWTYSITVASGQTLDLASYTVVGTTRAEAVAAANALVTHTGFDGQAAAFLNDTEQASLRNFDFYPVATTTTLLVAPNPSVYGQSVTFTATVIANVLDAGTPTGTVTFIDGSTTLGTASLGTNGQAVFTTSLLTAGRHEITASYNGNANFVTSTSAAAIQTVNTATLIITADNQTMVYGAALPTLTASFNGFVNGDTAAGLAIQPAITTTATSASHVGTYAIMVSGAVDPNYTISYMDGTLSVTPAVLTIAADNTSKLYDAALPTLTASIDGFVNGETLATSGLTGEPSFSCTANSDSPVGDYTITAALGTLGSQNYSFQFVEGKLSITQAMPSVSVSHAGGIYNGSPFPATATVTDVSGVPASSLEDVGLTMTYYVGTSVSGSGSADAPSAAGTYTVVASFAGSVNYTAAQSAPITFTINLVAPVIAASDKTFTDKVRVTWNAVSNATAYEIWRNTTNDSSKAARIKTVTGTSHDDTTAVAGKAVLVLGQGHERSGNQQLQYLGSRTAADTAGHHAGQGL